MANLLKSHFFALLLPPLVEMRCHGVIKHLLAPWRAAGDVLGIQENAACRQQIVDFPVQGSFSFVRSGGE